MPRFWKIVLGVASVGPLVGLLILYTSLVAAFDAIEQAGDISPQLVAGGFPEVEFWRTLLLILALWIFYLVWLVRTSRLGAGAKLGWAVLITLAGPLAMPVFWWRHFRPSGAADR